MYRKLTKQVVVYFLVFSSCSLYAQSPAGIARQSVWLQGNFFSDSSSTRWLNFNQATSMDNNSPQIRFPGNMKDLRRATIFTVYQFTGIDQDAPVWKMKGGFGDLLLSSQQVYSESGKMKMVFKKTGKETNGLKKPETVISTYVRQQNSSSAGGAGNNNEVDIDFGNHTLFHQPAQSNGLVAEFIVYETILKEKQIAKIESYLAIKYGITLERNYVNSQGQTIWNRKTENVYSNNIAGIGRDDLSTLYQKQGTSCSSSDQLTIGVDKIAVSNSKNTGQLNDKDYLVWGDNAGNYTFNADPDQKGSNILLTQKKWLMKRSGKTAGAISTELKIDTKTLLTGDIPKEYFCLAIDRSGSGDFAPENCTYITPNSISPDGIASFSGIKWDTDGSGKDAFSFGLKTNVNDVITDPYAAKLLSFQVYPNPTTEGRYTIAVTLDKPTDIRINVYDIHSNLIETKRASGQANYLIPGKLNAASGSYIIKVYTPNKEFSQIIIKP
jgi:hypothetical protein